MTGIATAIGVGTAVSVGAGLYESSQQAGISGKAVGLAQQTQAEQEYYNQQLMALMANPSSFLTSPIFQSSLNQGLSGVSRQMAAQGYLGSGNQATALEQYGQSQALGGLQTQEQILSADAGVASASSPAQGLGVGSSAAGAAANQLGGSLASLGFTLSNYQNAQNSSLTPVTLQTNTVPWGAAPSSTYLGSSP